MVHGAVGLAFSALHSCKCSVSSSAKRFIIDQMRGLLHVADSLNDAGTHENQSSRLGLPRVQKDSAVFTRWARVFCKINVYIVRGLRRLKYRCTDAFSSTVTNVNSSDSSDVPYIQVRRICCDPDFDMALLDFHKKLLPSHSLWNFYIDIHFAERLIPLIDRASTVDVRMLFRGS